MAYALTPTQVASVTDVEIAFSTTRLLPAWEDIPEDFKRGNLYTRIASAVFYGDSLPNADVQLKPGFQREHVSRAIRAHLRSFSPKHEHKIAGVGYMLSCATVCSPVPAESAAPDA